MKKKRTTKHNKIEKEMCKTKSKPKLSHRQ